MTHTIVSKRTSPFTYIKWVEINGQFHQDGPGIIINGGAGIVGGADLLSGVPLEHRRTVVPGSVLTFVDDKALAKLESIPKFQHDVKRGILLVYKNKKLTQGKGDELASKDMLPDEHIPTRPITTDEMEAAGAVMTNKGAVDISEVKEDMSPLKIRKQDAGLPFYEKTGYKNKKARGEKPRRKR